jgi:glucosamine--fructose-6-phosphate aminotransferase (isomerizing)
MSTILPRFAADLAMTLHESLDLQHLRAVVAEDVAVAVADHRLLDARRLLLCGSGDSMFAACGALPALRRWTGLLADAPSAMEMARYEVPLLAPNDVVVAISNSGRSSRVREAVTLARAKGVLTLGITGTLSGQLAGLAERVVHRPVREPMSLPAEYARCFLNLAEYIAVLWALYAFALELGARLGTLGDATRRDHYRRMETAIAQMPDVAASLEPVAERLAAELIGIDTIWAIGAGPSRGTAEYSAAKFHEQMPINGIAQDLEEWAHLEYFLTLSWGARSVVLVLAPSGNSLDRAEELVEGIAGAGGRALVVTGAGVGAFPRAHARLDVPVEVDEWLSPLLYHLPAQLLVLHLAHRAGAMPIPLRRRDDAWLIAKGLVRDDPSELR